MNIVKENKLKQKMSKISSHNVSLSNYSFLFKQKNQMNNKKYIRSTTLNNTVNNSISSIKPTTKNSQISSKNNLFNSFKQKTYFKEYAINQKMYLKNNKINNNINDNKAIKANFPIDLLNNNKSNTRYMKYYNKNKNNNNINKNKYVNNYINNNKNIKYSKKVYTKGNNIINNKSNLTNNNSKNRKQISSFTNPNINTSLGCINASKINKVNKITQSVNPINTYIINTLNVSEKEFLKTGISSSKPQKVPYEQGIDYQSEINKLIKEKEEDKSTIKKQRKLIEKFEEDNDILENKINLIIQENKKIKTKIKNYLENQEQLIMLVKIVQKSGVDVETLIDKWNNEVENMNSEEENEMQSEYKESTSDEINELNGKIDPSSFIPINIEKPQINKKVFTGIPKLNFSNINNKQDSKKQKYKNNSK